MEIILFEKFIDLYLENRFKGFFKDFFLYFLVFIQIIVLR